MCLRNVFRAPGNAGAVFLRLAEGPASRRSEECSGEPDQQYFSDGPTEDIITELAHYRSLFVIARNSSFQFRGAAVDLGAIRRKLGVRYIVEGSVRRSGGRLRVTAQLIDAATETHLWAERYDRDMQDVFTVQEDVARTIAAILEGRVAASGVERAKRKPTRELAAYDYLATSRRLHRARVSWGSVLNCSGP
ncbi:MAG: hypothetical protein ACREPG_05335 [Candidatus Binatia bacterium]